MLILTRKPGESLYIGDVKVTIVELKGHQIRIGIDAPPEIRIYREEIYLQILEENKRAAQGGAEGIPEIPLAWKAAAGVPSTGSGGKGGSGDSGGDSGEESRKRFGSLSAFSTSVGASPRPTGGGNSGTGNTGFGSSGFGSSSSGNDGPKVTMKRKRTKADE